MKIHQETRLRSDNVVDLPVRLRPDQIERLDAAVARAPSKGNAVVDHGVDRIDSARDHAADVMRIRREREELFSTILFSDPSWDLLLTLFVHRVDGQPISVSSACNNAGVPPSTAFRHLSMLVEQGSVTRHSSATDPSIFYVEIGDDAFGRIVSLLSPAA